MNLATGSMDVVLKITENTAFELESIKIDGNDKTFEQFSELLATGDVHYGFWEKLRNLELQHADRPYAQDLKQANYFVMELSELRRFWCDVQSHL